MHFPGLLPKASSKSSGIEVVSLRSQEDRKIEQEAYAGTSLGGAADSLVKELLRIGMEGGYISLPLRSGFDEKGRSKRAIEIGQSLDSLGGMALIQAAAYRIRAHAGNAKSAELERAWHGIGEWLE